jgi:exopolysaccharide biosynthesis protein
LAKLLVDQGAYIGMSLDGGGSSTMVMEGKDGQPVILNSPIDNHIPGRERPVGNHLGIYAK